MLRKISSLKLTLLGMLALMLGVLLIYLEWVSNSAWIAFPLSLLSLNLLAALIVNPRFRRQSGLLIFHVCLLAVMLLATFGWMSNLKGRIEIMQGQSFNPSNIEILRQGMFHPSDRLESVNFQQGPIRVEYAGNLIRGRTESQILLPQKHSIITIGDNIPLRMAGYRFYTTSNKGYAAVLTWNGTRGDIQQGAIHFPSYPLNDLNQRNNWQTPVGEKIQFELLLNKTPPEQDAWVYDRVYNNGALRLRNNGKTIILEAGESVSLNGGTLRFEQIRMWMGYEIFYDPMLTWLFATSVVGIFGLAWHFYLKLIYTSAYFLKQAEAKEGSHA
jgi:cytochrome c biogenesis protein